MIKKKKKKIKTNNIFSGLVVYLRVNFKSKHALCIEFTSYDKSVTAYEHIFGFSPLVVVMKSACTLRFWS